MRVEPTVAVAGMVNVPLTGVVVDAAFVQTVSPASAKSHQHYNQQILFIPRVMQYLLITMQMEILRMRAKQFGLKQHLQLLLLAEHLLFPQQQHWVQHE